MTEVDVVLPEGVAEPTTKLASSTEDSKKSASSPAAAAPPKTTTPPPTTETDENEQQKLRRKSTTDSIEGADGDKDGNNKKQDENDEKDETAKEETSEEVIDDEKKDGDDDAVIKKDGVKDSTDLLKKDVAEALPKAPQPSESMDVDESVSDKAENDEAREVADADKESADAEVEPEPEAEPAEGEDEDSQITTSSTKDLKAQEDEEEEDEGMEVDEEVATNGDHDHGATADVEAEAETEEIEEEDELDKIGSTAENSCEAEDPLGAATTGSTVDTDPAAAVDESEKKKVVVVVDVDKEEAEKLTKQTKETVNGFVASPKETRKENGQASPAEAKDSVVNLDEDSDEEVTITAKKKSDVVIVSAGGGGKQTISAPASSCGAESSDDAVLIPSDSESESAAPASNPPATSQLVVKPTPPPSLPLTAAASNHHHNNNDDDDDDDDDDCVVIEDDSPPSNQPLALGKRKAIDLDDLQANSKRQRSSTPSGLGQLTIKDARSLMPHDLTASVGGGNAGAGIYPVTITNAVTGAATNLGVANPPKLVPMGNSAGGLNAAASQLNTPTLTLTGGLPSMTNNANLLPGLTDDMFVLEAPSFIVPYIYEKPPHDNIREVIKAIEAKYSLSPEDLAEAVKGDEFDMMTEQNKEDKPLDQQQQEAAAGKKKKKRGDDESWSEQSDDDDDDEDDDDSESGVRTKVLIKEANDDLTALKGAIKPAAALAASGANAGNSTNKPGQENYFESPLGMFFMDIGVGQVQEFVQSDLLRLQKRKMRKSLSRDPKDFEMAINALSGNLQASKTKNAPFKFTMKRCEFCNFKSESALSMANHYETPHMNGVLYKCNFCTFEIRNANEIVYHMEAVHNIKARLIKPLPYHQCPNCGFEDNGKAKLARHQPVCAKKFRPELNLAPPNDWEAPAKIPRIKPRHGLVGTATAYQAMAAQAAAQKAALATIQQQQAQAQARNMQAAALAAQNAAKIRQRAPQLPKSLPAGNSLVRNPAAPVRGAVANAGGLSLPNSYQLAAGQLVQQASKKPMAGQPSISITPLPRQSSSAGGIGGAGGSGSTAASSSTKVPAGATGMKPGQSPSGNNKAQFVICEICDGYIKDLEQLRNHMQWMHKVKIHPKMIYNRPPLNCQKCQFRFFTDQGLERHLLGSHGLVTSSMQEAANRGKDAGRCPVCGRMYQWKLLNHVSRDHHMTLKPAHLSYKCTVCTATFGMYKQFETHVYTAHSTVARKAMDSKKNSSGSSSSAQSSGGGSGSGLSRNSLGAANDSLLKPLKINDEITIIPQPASKPRITNMESHVID
ncbi:uncharacterized protein LOC6645147 [Drosophila willistoni]|nr:uncharacterized protein LOC6645147 [Drosophila willistoni]